VKRYIYGFIFLIAACTVFSVGAEQSSPDAPLYAFSGAIRIGSTRAACSAAYAGTLGFADGRLQLCDGTSWRKLSLDKAQ
jgi:hypothetical protein